MIWILVFILLLSLIPIIVVCVTKTKQALNDQDEIKATLPKIFEGERRAKATLNYNGIISGMHVSSMGHKFIDYKTVHHAPDNLNIDLDFKNRKIACYMLNPFEFHLYNFSDLYRYDFTVNDGSVDFSSVNLNMGKYIGGIGIGVGVTNGSAQQEITAMILMLQFRNGEFFPINFTHNVSCYKGDSFYNRCMMQAKTFCQRLDLIIEENQNNAYCQKNQIPIATQQSPMQPHTQENQSESFQNQSTKKVCPNCSSEHHLTAVFCAKCGTRLD